MTQVCVQTVPRVPYSWADDRDDDDLDKHLICLSNFGRSKAPVKVEPVVPVAVERNAPDAGPVVIIRDEDSISRQVDRLIKLLQNGGAIPRFGEDPNGQADLGSPEVRNALRRQIYHLCRTGVIFNEHVRHFLRTHIVRIHCKYGSECRNHQHKECTFWYGHFMDGHPPNPPASGGGRGRKSP